MASKDKDDGFKRIATNRRARFDYELLERFEAGIVLLGPEVKSLRAGKASLVDAFGMVRKGELWLMNAHISPYEQAGRENSEAKRPRKLLMKRVEIGRLGGKIAEKGLTLVCVSLYWKDGRAKCELALARGKRHHDKRHTIRERDEKREIDRAMKGGRGR
ncbi:MAG: SsrA-binding protein SmpB [Deltaproteobacteria bacterium]|nr:SsrA-binding protein SmpB [Deltaproteobacteria bacterium]MBW2444904.1 SsrA-binding protein SmpB [Deltaproteobacteria bacterium]